jgi:nicotinamidase-related amidase
MFFRSRIAGRPMGTLKASPGDRAAHLCIDMQRLFAEGGPWLTPWMPRVLPTIEKLVARAPERTIFTRFIPPNAPGDASGMWRAYYAKWPHVTQQAMDRDLLRLVPELESFAPPAHIVDKPVYSAFATGALRAYLQDKDVDTLLVTGSETDVCVLATVLDAVDCGYRVIVVKDGLCSSSDAAHEASLHLYSQRFDIQIELAEADEVLETWRP